MNAIKRSLLVSLVFWAGISSIPVALAQVPNTLVGGYYNATPPTPVASGVPYSFQFDNAGNLLVNIKGGAAAGGTSSNFAATFPPAGTASGAEYLSSPPTYSVSGQMQPLLVDAAGNLLVNIKAGAAAGGTSSNFAATFPTAGTASGAQYLTSSPTYSVNGQMQPLIVDSAGNLLVNVKSGRANIFGNNGAPLDTTPGGTAANNALQVQGVAGMTLLQTSLPNLEAALSAGTAPSKMVVGGSIYNSSAPAPTSGQTVALQSDLGGNLKVNVAAGGATGSNFAATFPASGGASGAEYLSSAPTYTVSGQMQPLLVDASGNLLVNVKVGGGGGGGGSSNFAAGFPTAGAAAGAEYLTSPPTYSTNAQMQPLLVDSNGNLLVDIKAGAVTQGTGNVSNPWYVAQSGNWSVRLQDGLGNNINSTSNALNVYLNGSGVTVSTTVTGPVSINCGGNPCLATDENSFTFGTGTYSTIGGVFQTTATNNPLTTGQAGIVQMTAYRALMTNSRDSAGSEVNDATNHAVRIVCATGVSTSGFCNPVDEAAFTAGSSGFSAIGGLYQTTATSNALTNGEAGAAQLTANRAVHMNVRDSGGTEAMNTTAHSVKESPLDSGGGDMTDTTDHALQVVLTPSAGSTYGVTPVVSTAVESNHVLKASAGNLLGAMVQTGATAGCLMIFNATSAPADGAVTPAIAPVEVAANSTVGVSFPLVPAAFSTGITVVFSSTCGLTKTASATALFSGQVK